MSDGKFLQEQINDLQKETASLKAEVNGNTEQVGRIRDDVADVRNDITFIKRDMMTVPRLQKELEDHSNTQIVRGLKYAAGLVVAAVAVKWVEAMDWFQHLGE